VVIYDKLVPARLLEHAPANAARVCVTEFPGGHPERWPHVHAAMIDAARQGKCVVRLKGGDPFLFGRGGEEALALAAAGVTFEVVPGVSSALAVPAYAGIPVTQRGLAAQLAIVTGHEDPSKPDSEVDWAGLAAFPGTLVFLMGMGALEDNMARLLAYGKPPQTPAAVIASGTTAAQRTVRAPLAEIAAAARGLAPPAIALVGAVAALHEQLAWFERRPLFGRRVVVTRARAQASVLAARLAELGAEVVEAPAIRIEPLPFEPPDLGAYDVLALTSANGVELLLPEDVRVLQGVTVAAIGQATAEALRRRGVVADVVPPRAVAESLLEALADVRGRRVLVAVAEGARDVLPRGLAERGAQVDVLHLYRTLPEPLDAAAAAAVRAADLVTFTSSSTVEHLLAALRGDGAGLRAVSIGPVTSERLRRAGVEPLAEADPHDVDGLVEAVRRAAAELR
jgi:uroporphyrinogen III methyltransferase/synthase